MPPAGSTYAATVARTAQADGSQRFDIGITYGGVDVGVVAGAPEIVETLVPIGAAIGKQVTHTLDQYDHDAAHLYAKVTVSYSGVPCWVVEIYAQPDSTTPTGHAYWASASCIDPSAPISIRQTVN